eukprot:scpid45235/ scgid31639/ Cathepsin B-like cysteine proteinase; Antigen Sm31
MKFSVLAVLLLAAVVSSTPVRHSTPLKKLKLMSRSSVSWESGVPRVHHEVVEQTHNPPSRASKPVGNTVSSSQAAHLLWHQHEEAAIYNYVAISTQGYVAASTWLNPPEMVEVYKIKGDAVTRKTATVDENHDGSSDIVAMSRDSTVCVGMVNYRSNFSTALYVWDLQNPSTKPEWHHMESGTIGVGTAVSADGSLIALQYLDDISYLRPNAMGISFLSNTGEVLSRYQGRELETPLVFGMSSDGHYVAYVSQLVVGEKRELNLTVVEYVKGEKRVGQKFTMPITAFSQHLAVSASGEYIAMSGLVDEKLSLAVYHKSAGDKLAYTDHALPVPEGFFLINLAFSPEGYHLATTWAARTLHQNALVAYDLPAQKDIYSYMYPVDTGDKLEDEPASVAISSNGEYIAVGSWGTLNETAGSEQIQVFKVGEKEPILKEFTPGSMFAVDIMKNTEGVYVVAGGKSTQANVMGNGGDLYVYEIAAAQQQTPSKTKPEDLKTLVNDPDLIDSVNKENVGWKAGPQKQFEGMKLDDVRGLFGTKLMNMESISKLPSNPEHAKALPESFDSRKQWKGCVHPIRNQGHCGSCWAFSATESLSDRLCIASESKVNVVLSPEYLVECDTTCHGCGGGWLIPAWDFMETKGVPIDACYPYAAFNGSAGHCQPRCTAKTTESFKRYKAKPKSTQVFKTVEEMQESIMKYGPIQAGFTVFSDFMTYKSGVYKHTAGFVLGGHGIKIVGWGVQPTTEEKYWIVANSWGSDWGELGGYFWFERGTDQCLMESNSCAGLADVTTFA